MYLVVQGCLSEETHFFGTLDEMLKKYNVDSIESLLEKSTPFCIYTVYKIKKVWRYDD